MVDNPGCPPPNEQALVQGCLGGNPDCWQRFYLGYRREVWGVLHRLLGSSPEVEDLTQTVFFKAHRSLHRFEARSRLSTWLYQICVHVAMDHLRSSRRRRTMVDLDHAAPLSDPRPDPCSLAEQKESSRRLGLALAKIKDAKRTVLVLHDLMDVSAEEIARSLTTPVPTIRSRLFHARRELARHLARQKGTVIE
jgi:RNA polymerase sigma-70 factor (ECF subfamily)